MATSECHVILRQIVDHFEALAAEVEQGIQRLADDDCPTIDLAALHRCRDAARRGAIIATNAMSRVGRPFH